MSISGTEAVSVNFVVGMEMLRAITRVLVLFSLFIVLGALFYNITSVITDPTAKMLMFPVALFAGLGYGYFVVPAILKVFGLED